MFLPIEKNAFAKVYSDTIEKSVDKHTFSAWRAVDKLATAMPSRSEQNAVWNIACLSAFAPDKVTQSTNGLKQPNYKNVYAYLLYEKEKESIISHYLSVIDRLREGEKMETKIGAMYGRRNTINDDRYFNTIEAAWVSRCHWEQEILQNKFNHILRMPMDNGMLPDF